MVAGKRCRDRMRAASITATVPEQMKVDSATTSSGAEATRKERVVTFEPITVKAGDRAVFEIFVMPQQTGDVRFKVDMTAAELTGPVRKEESTTIYNGT